jgi:hypothetical protein
MSFRRTPAEIQASNEQGARLSRIRLDQVTAEVKARQPKRSPFCERLDWDEYVAQGQKEHEARVEAREAQLRAWDEYVAQSQVERLAAIAKAKARQAAWDQDPRNDFRPDHNWSSVREWEPTA